jgi:hypothetical protein
MTGVILQKLKFVIKRLIIQSYTGIVDRMVWRKEIF